MFNVRDILNVFSNRVANKNKIDRIEVSKEVRTRTVMIIRDKIEENTKYVHYYNSSNAFPQMLIEVRGILMFKLGKFNLSDIQGDGSDFSDITQFIFNCNGEQFFDFLEYIFKTKSFDNIKAEYKQDMVNDINYIFDKDSVPYQLTSYIEEWKEVKYDINQSYNGIQHAGARVKNVIAYPQIICKENEFIYEETTKSALELVKDGRFTNANKEFLEALDHYKNTRYKECITSCCSSLESVLKVIFRINKLKYNDNSTLNPLIKQLKDNKKLDGWLETLLTSPAVIRNKLGSSHGKGDSDVVVTRNQARYQINITASEIIFLIKELV